jgi:hypothetical protein
MAKDKSKRLEEIDQKILDLRKEKKQLEAEINDELVADIIHSTTIDSTVHWEEKGKPMSGVVKKISSQSVKVQGSFTGRGGKPTAQKSVAFKKIKKVEPPKSPK